MKEKSKKNLKIISKILEVITIIGKVCSIIAIPCIVLVMVFTPFFINNIKISDNKYGFKIGSTNIVLAEEGKNDASLKLSIDGEDVSSIEEAKIMDAINDALKNTSKTTIIVAGEISLAFLVATMIFSILVLNNAIKLFKNIGNKETPFIDENVLYLKNMAKFMIVAFVLPIIASVIIEIITGYDIGSKIQMYNLLEILALLALTYIFEYGVELQSRSKKKNSGDKDTK